MPQVAIGREQCERGGAVVDRRLLVAGLERTRRTIDEEHSALRVLPARAHRLSVQRTCCLEPPFLELDGGARDGVIARRRAWGPIERLRAAMRAP